MRRSLLLISLSFVAASPGDARPQLDFAQPVSIADRLPRHAEAHPADFDGDGDDDLLLEIESLLPYLVLYTNDGTGQVSVRQTVPPVDWNSPVEVADFTGDGIADFVVDQFDFSATTDGLWLFPGASGTAPLQGIRIGAPVFELVFQNPIVTLDLDGDGDLDVVRSRPNAPAASYINDGAGGFTEVGAFPSQFYAATGIDFDDDGRDDVISGGFERWWRSRGDGTFEPPQPLISGFFPFERMRRADVDGDGDLDAIHGAIWLENGPGTSFAARRDYGGTPGSDHINDVVDLDLDGIVDLLVVRGSSIALFRGMGGGAFHPAEPVPGTPTGFLRLDTRLAAPWDADGDGDLDVLLGWNGNSFANLPMLVENTTDLGSVVCAGLPNSTGSAGRLEVTGSDVATMNRSALAARALPAGQFTLFFTSSSSAPPSMPPGSDGELCLGSPIGRFDRIGELTQSDAGGTARLPLDLQDVPDAVQGSVAVLAGETRLFQAWHRDAGTGSNFTEAVTVTFR